MRFDSRTARTLSTGFALMLLPLATVESAVGADTSTRGAAAGMVYKVQLSNRCLDADTNTINNNGGIVQLWNCNGQPQQAWYRGADHSIRLKYNGKCLDHDTTQNRNGGKVQLWDCNGSPQQSWR